MLATFQREFRAILGLACGAFAGLPLIDHAAG
jgi:hypothetical protein